MRRSSAFARVVTEFLKQTTLHGFKYLTLCYYFDRVFWTLVCVVSACSAGGLFRVVWARFQQQPAVLTLQELHHHHYNDIPLVICPPPELIAQTLFGTSCNESSPYTPSLSYVLEHIIRKKPLEEGHGEMLDHWLAERQTDLVKALLTAAPECEMLLTFCRWQYKRMACGDLFNKQITEWGACCVLNQTMLLNPSKQMISTSRLDLVLECSNTSVQYGCEFFTMYEGEDGVLPVALHQGLSYTAQLIFTATMLTEQIGGAGECVRARGYSKGLCGIKCLETLCGCSHPLMSIRTPETMSLPVCSVAQISCLHSDHHFHEDASCNCPTACTAYNSDLILESIPMEFIQYALDPIYAGLDMKTSIVLQIRLRLSSSKIFTLHATESWFTLLSSLGGVFNMFLGVGMFSALEIVIFLLIKLPLALRTSTKNVEMLKLKK